MSMIPTIRFLGGAGTVTGSKFLVRDEKTSILVDCGMFQGLKELRLLNWGPLPVKPASIDYLLLTHAHLDHVGYLPVLIREGFRGRIYCTAPTRELARIILLDSARIQEEEADLANRKEFSKHKPALPLYTIEEARIACEMLEVAGLEQWTTLDDQWRFRFIQSGHILGSAFIELESPGCSILFTGDLGRAHPLTLRPPERVARATFLVVESTYGDRWHPAGDPEQKLGQIVRETVERGGHVLIPAFAIGRTQEVLHLLARLKEKKEIPDVPVFLDSPMGIEATRVSSEYAGWYRLSATEIEQMHSVAQTVTSPQMSQELRHRDQSSIVIAGSGMMTGGRILGHLEARLSDPRNTVVLVGFQAASTRGRLLLGGIKELKFHGRYVPVGARIEELPALSAHADQAEIIEWMRGFESPPHLTFIVHGEPQASDALRVKVKDTLGWRCVVPRLNQECQLE